MNEDTGLLQSPSWRFSLAQQSMSLEHIELQFYLDWPMRGWFLTILVRRRYSNQPVSSGDIAKNRT